MQAGNSLANFCSAVLVYHTMVAISAVKYEKVLAILKLKEINAWHVCVKKDLTYI